MNFLKFRDEKRNSLKLKGWKQYFSQKKKKRHLKPHDFYVNCMWAP